jgi:hypothetical protein
MRTFIKKVNDKVGTIFLSKTDLRKQLFLSRLTSYSRYNSDTTSVTLGFQNKTKCYLYVCQDLVPYI